MLTHIFHFRPSANSTKALIREGILSNLRYKYGYILKLHRGSFVLYVSKIYEKLTILTPYTHTYVWYQGARNNSFSEKKLRTY